MPAAGAVSGRASSLNRIIALHAGRALELQTDGHEVVWRPRSGVLEAQLSLVALSDLVHFLIELVLLVATDEERRVHDHLVADHFVGSRRDRRALQLVIDLAYVEVRLVREGLLYQPTELHA